MKWLITGGSGQLGNALSNVLATNSIDFISLTKEKLDISEISSISTIKEISPGVIVNCAAWTNVDGAESNQSAAFAVNEAGARNVAIAASELKIPLMHISTDYVFSGESKKPWSVNSLREPLSIYGCSKLAGEIAVQEVHQEASYILRTGWLFSRWGRNFVKTILRAALLNEKVNVVSDQFGQPTSALDLAKQITLLMEHELPFGFYHGTNSGEASWFDFACTIFKFAGMDENNVSAVKTFDYPTKAKRPSFSVLDLSKWYETLVPPMRSWKDALKDEFPYILNEIEKRGLNG